MALQQNVDWANMSMVDDGSPQAPYLFYNGSGQINIPAGQWNVASAGAAGSQVYFGAAERRGILWGPERKLDYWAALRAGGVPEAEKRAVSLLASISDERRLGYYLHSGLFPALGNATKRIYMVRRFHTVVELDDGVPAASWCILTKDRGRIPETDHVVAMKNLIEGEEMAFREVGNCFQPNTDPFVGQVPLESEFPNPYLNAPIGSPRVRKGSDVRKPLDEQRILREETRLRQGDAREIALRRSFARWLAAFSLARRWTPNLPAPPQRRVGKTLTEAERMLLRVRDTLSRGFGVAP